MILCITPNPAVDRTLIVPQLNPGQVHRATRTLVAAGGKGLNVARASRILGGDPLCMGFLGGHSGRLVAELAGREGLRSAWTWTEAETRTCVIVVDELAGDATVFNENGPLVNAADWAALSAEVRRESASAEIVCLSGSLPPGSPVASLAGLLRELCAAGEQVWVDTSGTALSTALSVAGLNLKVNAYEAGAILNRNVDSVEAAFSAARALQERGANQVVITLGQAGAILVMLEGVWHAQPPTIRVMSSVGSGDSFLAGLVVAAAEKQPPPEALRWAVAAGTANALSAGGGQFSLGDFRSLLAQTSLSP
jgi:1-phosphofructokinase family hexose kinase